MLQAQVNYWNLVEQKRHNVATETQAQRELEETSRHNKSTELYGFLSYAETAKHNRETEKQARRNLQFDYANLAETSRSHRANEAIARSNVAIGWANAATQSRSVSNMYETTKYANTTNRMNAITNRRNLRVNEAKVEQQYLKNIGDLGLGVFSNVTPKITVRTNGTIK